MVNILPLTLTQAIVKKRGKKLIGPVSHTFSDTGTTIVMGPNGSGKTTLLRLMHGLERARDGRVDWHVNTEEARHHQAYVFQQPIMMRRSVQACLAYPLRLQGTPKAHANQKAIEWAERVGIAHALNRSAMVLSGGEKQKLALARALIRSPQVLFLDEPCANLDGAATRDIETILLNAHHNGTRIFMATHDMGQARRLADTVVFMLHGKIHEASDAEPFFETPKTTEALAFLNGDIIS
ncbi:MAG: ATP-binding cassette domain-containing protein [Pseudoruegeria sp.]